MQDRTQKVGRRIVGEDKIEKMKWGEHESLEKMGKVGPSSRGSES